MRLIFRNGQFTFCMFLIILLTNSLLSEGKLMFHNKITKRALIANENPVKQVRELDGLAKRQVFGGPYYAPPAGCGPGGCTSPCCGCPSFSPMVGCAPPVPAALPPHVSAFGAPVPPPPPVPAGRLIPQALPGAPCEPGVECTGGSVCSMGICLCPPELVQEGTVCVSRTIYGVVPPPGPGPVPFGGVPPPPPPPAYAFQPPQFQPAPFAAYSPPLLAGAPPPPPPPPAPISYGRPCGPDGCVPGAFCEGGFCRCGPGYGGSCLRKRQPSSLSLDFQDSEEQS